MRSLILLLATLMSFSSSADSGLPFMKDLAGDADLPRPWGIGFDFYTMDQDYDIRSLSFELPGVSIGDPSDIKVTNEVKHYDIQVDAWLLPFLNVFGIVGRVGIDTLVDFSPADIQGLPPGIDLGVLPVSFNGTVWGGGFTLIYGSETWFASVTTSFAKTNTSGGLNSKVNSTSVQPRIGLLKNGWRFWVGGMYLDTDEKHSGDFNLPFLGEVPFAVELNTRDNWNYAVGAGYAFGGRFNLSLEAGFGDRTHTLLNLNTRF